MKKAIIHTKAGKSLPVEYEKDEVEDIFVALDGSKRAMIAMGGLTVFNDSIEAIEWID